MMCPECMRGFYCGECNIVQSDDEEPEDVDPPETRRNKPDSALKDQQSTGRKRAAKLYPLDRLAKCEWEAASETNPMGGGTVPITMTCTKTRNGNGLQQQRHHGPSKNTLDNEPDNVHRICNYHHAWWHALNDADYDWSKHNDIRRD